MPPKQKEELVPFIDALDEKLYTKTEVQKMLRDQMMSIVKDHEWKYILL